MILDSCLRDNCWDMRSFLILKPSDDFGVAGSARDIVFFTPSGKDLSSTLDNILYLRLFGWKIMTVVSPNETLNKHVTGPDTLFAILANSLVTVLL